MTSRERVRAAMGHEAVDRVPVMCQLALGHYFLHSQFEPADIWFDSEVLARTLADFQRRYRFDGFLINLPGRPTNWRDNLAGRERLDNGQRLTWRNGLETLVPSDDNPHTRGREGRPLARAEVGQVDVHSPTLYRTEGYVWNTWHAPSLWDFSEEADLSQPAAYPDWFTLGLRTARADNPDVSIHVEVFSPFTHLMELFGYENALMALLEAPALCHELLTVFSGQAEAQIAAYAACDPDAILISSAFAGAGFISRAMYESFVLPYERRLTAAVQKAGLISCVHTCGAIGDRLDLMIETGVDGIDTLDPPPLGTVDLAEAKKTYGDRVFFKGNLDAVNEMLRAGDADFETAVRHRLEIGRPGSGYILSSACSVAPHVDPHRLIRMVELAEDYG